MKKYRFFSLRILRRWTVPVVGFLLLILTTLAWKGVEKYQKISEAQYVYGAYEMVDRCLTAFYNNDPDALLALFREDYLVTVQERTKQDAETMRSSIRKAMNDAYVQRQASGTTYEWSYIGWLDDAPENYHDYDGLGAEMGVSNATSSRMGGYVKVLLKETVGNVTTEKELWFVVRERDEQWSADLPTMPWIGEILFTSGGLQPYRAVREWMSAWYTGPHDTLPEGIPAALLDAKVGADRTAWETALMAHLDARAEPERAKGTTYRCNFSNREDLPEGKIQSLKQEYKDLCGLEVTDAMHINYTLWVEVPPQNDKELPTDTWTSTDCTVVKIDGKWYMETLHLNAEFNRLWHFGREKE